jgi:hypothetical protein
VSTLLTEARSTRGWRRWAARLALLLIVFAVLQPALGAPVGAGPLRYIDVSLKAANGSGAWHHHGHTLCHSCAGHICLEQHGALDQAPIPLVAPRPWYALPIPWVQVALWPHPATAPPLRRIAQAPQARAPPLFA